MKVAFYTRYSSQNQRQESIEAQISAIEKHLEGKEYDLYKIYRDEAISGTNDSRPAFQLMINDAMLGKFDVLYIHKFDRFARDKYDSVFYKRKLKDAGVKVVSIVENFDTTKPENILLESLIEGMSEFYSRNLSREAKKGLMENAKQCKHTGGRPLYGYKVNPDKTYSIDKHKAKAVKKMFEIYANTGSYVLVNEWLKEHGYKTSTGKVEWPKTSILTLLKNERYKGTYTYIANNRSKYESDREVIRIEGGMPRIISDELFSKVNSMVGQKQYRKGHDVGKTLYLLSGLLECSECGSVYHGNSFTSRGNFYAKYRCDGTKKKICDVPQIDKDEIENLILNHLKEEVFTEEVIDNLTNMIMDQQAEMKTESDLEYEMLEEKEKQLKKELDNMTNAIAAIGISDTLMAKFKEIENDYNYVKVAKDKIAGSTFGKLTKDQVKNYISKGQKIYYSDPYKQKELIHTFIKKIQINSNQDVIIDYYIYNKKTPNSNGKGVMGNVVTPTRYEHIPKLLWIIQSSKVTDRFYIA